MSYCAKFGKIYISVICYILYKRKLFKTVIVPAGLHIPKVPQRFTDKGLSLKYVERNKLRFCSKFRYYIDGSCKMLSVGVIWV